MLKIDVRVSEDRNSSAVVTLGGGANLAQSFGAASAARDHAARNGNPACDPLRPCGHPPYGTYLLLKHASTPEGCAIEYGSHILLFEAQSGPALEAESLGRLALAVYAGPLEPNGRPRRTQGGLRLSDSTMHDVIERLKAGDDIALSIGPLRAPRWWQFWRLAEQVLPLSPSAPRLTAPPHDEASIVAQMLHGTKRQRRPAPLAPDNAQYRRDDWDRPSERDFRSSQESPFEGKGGRSGGAGASGSWDAENGRASRTPPGVDSSGRITETAIAAAAGAALFAAATESRESDVPQENSAQEAVDADDGAAAETGETGTAY